MPRLLLDPAPLRVVAYRRLWVGGALTGVGAQLTVFTVGLEVYDLTRSTPAVGVVGLVSLVPLVAAGLYGGAVIDAVDRRIVIVASTGATLVVSGLLAVQAVAHVERVWLLYLLAALQSGLFGIGNPARSATIPRVLPVPLLPAANALGGLGMGVAFTAGPVLGGILVSQGGFAAAYVVDALLCGVAVVGLAGLPAIPPLGPVRVPGLRSVLAGFAFLGTRADIRMTFLVDLAAMILAMPRVLFPAVGAVVLGGGARTTAMLAAALALGSAVTGVLSGSLGTVRRQGRAVLIAVVVWGAAVAAFGAVLLAARGSGEQPPGTMWWLLVPALGALLVAGAADAVSAVFRMTILQAATPDEMRGRLQGVFTSVVAGGPRLGDLVVGSMAGLAGEAVAGLVGGVACVVVVLLLGALQPAFAEYDARERVP